MTKCPKCGAEPFDQFLSGQVARFGWFGLRKAVYAVICWCCKSIVGYESNPPRETTMFVATHPKADGSKQI